MRRNLSLLFVLVALLALGGLAAANGFNVSRMLFKGTYVPNITTPLTVPGLENAPAALVLVGGVAVTLAVVFGLGIALGQGALQATKAEAAFKAKEAPQAAAPAVKPAPAAKGPEPVIPLASNQSLIIFWVILSLAIVAFMAVRFYKDIGGVYMPNPAAELFVIPGAPVKGLPEFIPSPGKTLTAGWAFPVIMLVSLAVAAGAGFGLARLFVVMDAQVKNANQLPRTGLDRLIAEAEKRFEGLFAPKPARTPGNLFDQAWMALNVLLFVAVIAVVAMWVLPGLNSINAVNKAIEATQVAALWTPTPLPGPSPTPGPSPDEAFALLPAGDAASGQALAVAQGCEACHVTQAVVDGKPVPLTGAPWLASMSEDGKGVGTHAEERWQAADYKGEATSAAGYLYESLVNPSIYVVPGNPAYAPGGTSLMPGIYGQTLTSQNIADIIAYLLTVK